ncbi:MAG: hypothetical protein QME96_01690 [Myxococcota bacterium]|nr:hypothetical protein [Myxococcota bacterium]
MTAIFRWRRWRIAAVVSACLGIALVLAPQLGVLGFEAAFACAVVVPIAAGALGAGLRRSGLLDRAAGPWRSLTAVVVGAEFLVAVPLLLVVANMLRAPICDPLEGLAFFALLPGASAALAAIAGWALALATRTSFLATLAWTLVYLASVCVVGYRFMATPAVAFFGPFFGQFPGVLYDALVPISAPLLTLRATNLVEAAAIVAIVRWSYDPVRRRLSAGRLFRSRIAAQVVLPALGAVALGWLAGPGLGHRTSAEHIAAELGERAAGRVCDVFAPRNHIAADDLRLLVEDCDFRAESIRRFLGLDAGGERITVFAFQDEAQKARLMGAGRTSVAKPWRREVYVNLAGFPHPVLEHELAHVILGDLAPRPFRIPALAAGLLPAPGLIEGAAVAVEWAPDVMSPHGWAAAMDRLGLLPEADDLVGVGFLGHAAGLAYTAMGSFVRRLIETRGTCAFRRLYAQADFEAAYGRPVADLWTEWRAWLATVPLDDARIDAARARFDVPGFFRARCPRTVARLALRRDERAAAGDMLGAAVVQERICEVSGDDPGQRATLVRAWLAAGKPERALAEGGPGRGLRDDVEQMMADAWWVLGRREEALDTYRRLLGRATEAAERRVLLVKIHGLSDPVAEPFVRVYLVERPAGDRESALRLLEDYVRVAPTDPIAHYLLGRRLTGADRHADADAALTAAVVMGLSPDDLRLEAVRLLVALAYRAGDLGQAASDAALLAASGSERFRAEGADWLERIDWARRWSSAPAQEPVADASGPSSRL